MKMIEQILLVANAYAYAYFNMEINEIIIVETSYGDSYAGNDIIGIAVDLDNQLNLFF